MYLIEGIPTQYQHAKIDSLYEPLYPKVFFIHIKIIPIQTNTVPKIPATNIDLIPHFHTSTNTTAYPTSPVDQRLKRQFQTDVTGCQWIAYNKTSDTSLMEEMYTMFKNSSPPMQPHP